MSPYHYTVLFHHCNRNVCLLLHLVWAFSTSDLSEIKHCNIDSNHSVILLLLDRSAAFDTVDHSVLLSRLLNRFGVNGTVLAWFESYLKSRKYYYVQVEGSKSTTRTLTCGVPQGSVLGRLHCVIYRFSHS